ncbi:phytase [Cyanobacteria bacterium FACHB-472]|nr:phytase [Cyanobacteria bacterium FACHB-472]
MGKGIWKFSAEPSSGTDGVLIDAVKPEGSNLEADVEGLTIYYGGDGEGYLLASSQGDNTFAVYNRTADNDYLGSFAVGAFGDIDAVQESDGAAVINMPLGSKFPFGLFVTQDGSNDPEVLFFDEEDQEFENVSSNFKFVGWENIANAFPNPLLIDTTSFNPRQSNSKSVPEPSTNGFTLLAIFAMGYSLRKRQKTANLS